MTDPLGQSQVLPYLVGLSMEGFTFHLISFEKTEKFVANKDYIQQICDDAEIIWHPLSYTKKPPLLSTLYDLRRMKSLSNQLHKKHNFQIVHCRSYISALVGLSMKKRFGTKFLFDMRGFWADERMEGNIWKLNNPVFKTVYNFFKKKEIQYFREADYTISLTHTGKNEIENWKEFSQKKPLIEVIPCCVDLNLFDPEKIQPENQDAIKQKLGIQSEDYILGYVGSIGTWYMLSEMLDYFKILKQNNPHAKFLFVTGEKPETIIDKAKEKKIDLSDLWITSCQHKDVPLYISLFHASIFFIRPTFSKKASSPTKQGEIMAMGIPLICNEGVGDTDYVVEKYSSGIVLSELNQRCYNQFLDPQSYFNKALTMKGAKEFYGLENGVSKYLEVYKILSGN